MNSKNYAVIRCFKCLGRKWIHDPQLCGSIPCPDCKGTGVDEQRTKDLHNEHEADRQFDQPHYGHDSEENNE